MMNRSVWRDVISELVANFRCIAPTLPSVVPPDLGRRLADQLPDGRLVEITDSYTVVPLEQPKQLADAVRLPPPAPQSGPR
jgi:pimeloyl-ACP methyl ester carboxylesterase